ncbi:MAG: hypothetical protein ABIO88_15180 [Burkholderiaceae bacterium]
MGAGTGRGAAIGATTTEATSGWLGSRTGSGTFMAIGLTGAATGASMCVAASNTSAQRPQRTQPLDTLSWSGTTLKTVSQAGQRVLRLMTV